MVKSPQSAEDSSGLLVALMSDLFACIQAGLELQKFQKKVSDLDYQVQALYKLYSEVLEKLSELSQYV